MDHFRTQHGSVLECGDLLLWISQFDWAKPTMTWHSWILLDGEKMGVTSQVDETVLPDRAYKVYPNPTSQYGNIIGLQTEAEIDIYNIEGVWLERRNTIKDQIDISHLSAGLYILDIKTQDRSERHKVIKMN